MQDYFISSAGGAVDTCPKTQSSVISEITNCVNAMSVDALCELRNDLISDEVAFTINSMIFVRSISEIKQWAFSVGLRYKVHNYPDDDMYSYILNGQQNQYHFDTKQEAMIEAYKDAVKRQRIIDSELTWSDY